MRHDSESTHGRSHRPGRVKTTAREATTETYVALLRGINVGRAKRVAMSDLRRLVAGLGHDDVRTLLNSGNVVFTGAEAGTAEEAVAVRTARVASGSRLRS